MDNTTRHVVIKLGSQLLTDRAGQLDLPFLSTVASQVAQLKSRGVLVTVVSSGAISAGVAELKLPKRPTDLAKLQAVAAIGQRRLMDAWAAAFSTHGLPVAQLLLTREDIDVRMRFLNVRNTIHAVHELGGIPIVNENDTISTDEIVKITFGDNDVLAATVAVALRADMLVLLTVVDGLLDAGGKTVTTISSFEEAQRLVRSEKSQLGKGGMQSKLAAAKMVVDAGHAFVVANGRTESLLPRLLDGELIGTRIGAVSGLGESAMKRTAKQSPRGGRSRWLGAARASGTIVVDAGCAKALIEQQKSLLPAGVVSVDGEFARGDVVAVVGPDGSTIARGLTNYAAADVTLIRGKKTSEVRAMLSDRAYDEVMHRDNLVVVGK